MRQTTVATLTESGIDGVCRVCIIDPGGSASTATFGSNIEAADFVFAAMGGAATPRALENVASAPPPPDDPSTGKLSQCFPVTATVVPFEELAEKFADQVKTAIEASEKASLGRVTATVLRQVAEAAKEARVCVSESGDEVNIASLANLLLERADKAEGKHRKLRPV